MTFIVGNSARRYIECTKVSAERSIEKTFPMIINSKVTRNEPIALDWAGGGATT
jgi:hypothetical protein